MVSLVLLPEALQGHHISEVDLDLSLSEAKMNGRQVHNLNAGYHCDPEELNNLHPFWATEETQDSSLTRVSFNTTSLALHDDKESEENTDFLERGERPLCKVVEIIQRANAGEPVWKVAALIKDEFILTAMALIFEEVLKQIKDGKTYYFPDSSSLRLRSSPASINIIEKAYIAFRYIAGFPPLPIPKVQMEEDDIDSKLRIIREKIERICGDIHQEKSSSGGKPTSEGKPMLVRQASRSVYCCSP